MPWGYPPMPQPHTPGPQLNATVPMHAHTASHASPVSLVTAGPIIPGPAAQPSLEDWCSKHKLGNEERQGLIKLGFRVGDDNLVTLPASEWEWAGLGPLHKQCILTPYSAEQVRNAI